MEPPRLQLQQGFTTGVRRPGRSRCAMGPCARSRIHPIGRCCGPCDHMSGTSMEYCRSGWDAEPLRRPQRRQHRYFSQMSPKHLMPHKLWRRHSAPCSLGQSSNNVGMRVIRRMRRGYPCRNSGARGVRFDVFRLVAHFPFAFVVTSEVVTGERAEVRGHRASDFCNSVAKPSWLSLC